MANRLAQEAREKEIALRQLGGRHEVLSHNARHSVSRTAQGVDEGTGIGKLSVDFYDMSLSDMDIHMGSVDEASVVQH